MPNRPESHSRSDQADEQNARLKAFDAKFVSYSSAYNLTAVTRHLRFYKAFLASATSTGAPYFERDAKTNLDEPSPAFRALLTKALVRFEAWVRRVLPARISGDPLLLSEVPPLDVLAVLHAYLLSPKIFDHDSTVRFPQLQSITFPLEHLVCRMHEPYEYTTQRLMVLCRRRSFGLIVVYTLLLLNKFISGSR